jgi:hypothetical protein
MVYDEEKIFCTLLSLIVDNAGTVSPSFQLSAKCDIDAMETRKAKDPG